MHDIQMRPDGMFEIDWLELMLNTSAGPQDRLEKIIHRVANQRDDTVKKLGYELSDVKKLRQWLDVLVAQRDRAKARYKNLLTELNNELDQIVITRRPILSLGHRQLRFTSKVNNPPSLAAFALVVAEAFNTDLYIRVGKCNECQRRIDQGTSRGMPVDPNIGPYFVRHGRGDNRKYCTGRHTRAATMRKARERQKLQMEQGK